MTDEHFILLARTVIRLAMKGCAHPRCGGENPATHAQRCAECPLEAVDALTAELGRVAWENAEASR